MGKGTYAKKNVEMRIVLDTNVLLISLPKVSRYKPIFESLINHKIELLISNEIILEYLEIIGNKTTEAIALNVTELLITLRNVIRVEPHFRWNLIRNDADDNKFVDCAISGAADFIVTNDSHFNELKEIDFPKVLTLTADEFLELVMNIDKKNM